MNNLVRTTTLWRALLGAAVAGLFCCAAPAGHARAGSTEWHAAVDSTARGGGAPGRRREELESIRVGASKASQYLGLGRPTLAAWSRGPLNSESALSGSFTSQELPGADGNVLSMARVGSTLYVAGAFRSVGENTGGLVALDGGAGRVLPILPKVTGNVVAIVSDDSGGWYIGGSFTSVDGLPRENIAHILADGSVDAWHPTVAGPPADYALPSVVAILPKDGRVFIGGQFRMINGEAHENLGCVDARTGASVQCHLDVSGTIGAPGVTCLAASDSLIYIGGSFETIAGIQRPSLAAVNAKTLAVAGWHVDAYGLAAKLELRHGVLWVAGEIYVGDLAIAPRRLLAAIDATTGTVLPFDARAVGFTSIPSAFRPQIQDFVFAGDTLYVAGNFTSIGGRSRTSLAALDAVSGDALPWTPPLVGPRLEGFPPRMCTQLAVVGSTLYISGYFVTMGGESRPLMAAIRRDTGELLPWNPKPNNEVGSLVARGDVLIAGGAFNTVGDWRHRAGLAAIDLSTGQLKPWNPNPNGHLVSSVAAYKDRVFVSGDFTEIGGNPGPRHFLAALDTLNGELLPWEADTDELAEEMFIHNDALYMAGWFTSVGGQPRDRLAAVDPLSAEVLPWAPTVSDAVLATASHDYVLYIGGLFTAVNGSPRRGAAAVDLDTGNTLPWDPDPDNPTIESMCLAGDRLFLGGAFDYISGEPRESIAAVDLSAGDVLPWHPQTAEWSIISPRVKALAMASGKLVAGGNFSVMGGAPRICLAAVDTSTGLADDWNPDSDGLVWSLLNDGSDLYVGGGYTRLGGEPSSGLARFRSGVSAPPTRADLRLRPSLPNPAANTTLLRFDLPAEATVTLSVYDLQGRAVAVPIQAERLQPGAHGRVLDVHSWQVGVYFCRLEVGNRSAVRKLVVAN